MHKSRFRPAWRSNEFPGRLDNHQFVSVLSDFMPKKNGWYFFILYLAIFGSFCGLEIDTFNGELPFFRIDTLLLFLNILPVLLVPPAVYLLFSSFQSLWIHRAARTGVLILNSLYFHIVVFLLLYKAVRKQDFDMRFFWYNLEDVLPTVWKLFAPWTLAAVALIAAFIFLQEAAFSPVRKALGKSSRKAGLFLAWILLSSLLAQTATMDAVRGSTAGFLHANFLSDRRIRDEYRKLSQEHISFMKSRTRKPALLADPSILGDVVFFIKQESLNGLLTGSKITPQLLRAAQDGVLFEKQYANSIQSIRGYECILCGVPPSMTEAFSDLYPPDDFKQLGCLPQIFKSLGYRPFYFFGGSRNPRISRFAQSIGFEKVLTDEIVRPGDVKFDWGYREDIYFNRVHEYLQKRHPKDKLFVFIDTGATNHDPFEVLDDKLLNKIPFPKPKTFEERLSNTTFVQDAYFGGFYDFFLKHYAHRGTLLAVSDHAWPIPLHEFNVYNERGAFEENFLISMLFVPPKSRSRDFSVGSTVSLRFSQMDIVPTILDLIGIDQDCMLGESFAPWLLEAQKSQRTRSLKTKISIQPYGGGYISAIQYPQKYLFDVLGRKVRVYDLDRDPQELSPVVRNAGECMHVIRDFFQPQNRVH